MIVAGAAPSTVLTGPHSTSPAGDSRPGAAGRTSRTVGAALITRTAPADQPQRLSQAAVAGIQEVTTAAAAGQEAPPSSSHPSPSAGRAVSSGSSVAT